jgi:hypothetical protein
MTGTQLLNVMFLMNMPQSDLQAPVSHTFMIRGMHTFFGRQTLTYRLHHFIVID